MEKEEKQEILSEIAKLGFGITNAKPQIVDGKVQYYISGSVAMFTLANVESLTPMVVDADGNVVSVGEEIKFEDKNREAIEDGTRKLGHDLDLIETSIGKAPANVWSITQTGVDLAKCSSRGMMGPDVLSDDNKIGKHYVALAKSKDGQQTLICHPFILLMYKAQELLSLIAKRGLDDPKVQKDLKDFACLYHAIVETDLFPKKTREFVEQMMKDDPEFCTRRLTDEQYYSSIITLVEAVHPMIDDKLEDRLYDFADALKVVREPVKEKPKEK